MTDSQCLAMSEEACSQLGRTLKYNLSGTSRRQVEGGALDMSFQVFQLNVRTTALRHPCKLSGGALTCPGFHFGVHCPLTSRGPIVGLQGNERDEYLGRLLVVFQVFELCLFSLNVVEKDSVVKSCQHILVSGS